MIFFYSLDKLSRWNLSYIFCFFFPSFINISSRKIVFNQYLSHVGETLSISWGCISWGCIPYDIQTHEVVVTNSR
jgi:hypothetical protein